MCIRCQERDTCWCVQRSLWHSLSQCPCEQTSVLWRNDDYVINLKHLGWEPLATILQAKWIPCSGNQDHRYVLLCSSSVVNVSASLWDSDGKEQQVQSLSTDQNPHTGTVRKTGLQHQKGMKLKTNTKPFWSQHSKSCWTIISNPKKKKKTPLKPPLIHILDLIRMHFSYLWSWTHSSNNRQICFSCFTGRK